MSSGAAIAPVVSGASFWIATAIFIAAYILIISERLHKTVVALVGASLMLVFKVLDQREAFHGLDLGIDWNVIFLLISMMVIINIMRPTGLFEYLAIKCAKLGRGRPVRILIIFNIMTAVLSAALDNITTVLLIIPITILIADALEVDPLPYMITCALASNIGGTATLIGDPPNIMIASKAGLEFMAFIYHLTPAIIIIMAAYILAIWLMWRKKLVTREELRERIMSMNERDAITDMPLLIKSVAVLAMVLSGFTLQGWLGFEPATIALTGAGVLLLISGSEDTHRVFSEVEWPTLFFFIGLFIIIGGVVKVGLVSMMAVKVLELTQGNMFATSMAVMWLSAFASALIDNIPYVATMNPLIADMAHRMWPELTGTALLQKPELMPLWWSLALGACLGGNGTAIGASANVIVVGMSDKMGRKISFMRFMAYGMPVMIMTVSIATVYVWVRYYLV